MVLEMTLRNKEYRRYVKILNAGILETDKDKFYIQTKNRGCVTETFIPLTDIDYYNIREGR